MVLSFGAGWIVAGWLNLPAWRGFNASLMGQPSVLTSILGAIIIAGIGASVSAVVLGRIHYEAPILGGACALGAISLRGGGVQYALFAGGTSAFWQMTIESALLGAIVLALSPLSRFLLDRRLLHEQFGVEPSKESFDQHLLGTATHVAMMLVLLRFLLVTTDKAQVLVCVFIAALLGSLVAHRFVPARPAAWFIASPILASIAAQILAGLGSDRVALGEPGGYFAPLARALPLDYASAGVAGALIGYWMRRRKEHETEVAEMANIATAPGGANHDTPAGHRAVS